MAVVNVNILLFFGILSSFCSRQHVVNAETFADSIVSALDESCVVLIDSEFSIEHSGVVDGLKTAFKFEPAVVIQVTSLSNFIWPDGTRLLYQGHTDKSISKGYGLAVLEKQVKDRTCLIEPSRIFFPKATGVDLTSIDTLVEFVNYKCNSFRKLDGKTSFKGQHAMEIENHLYSVSTMSNVSIGTMRSESSSLYCQSDATRLGSEKCFGECDGDHCVQERASSEFHESSSLHRDVEESSTKLLPQCEEISQIDMSWETFFENYLSQSKPFILRNATRHWPAFSRWTDKFLRSKYGSKSVHIKLTPGGDFEGVEPASLWEDYDSFKIPDAVKRHLEFPDLVVVRPAALNMNFSEFLDLISWAAQQRSRNVSAYLEYSSIADYFPELEEDLVEFSFVKDKLKRRHLNMWLSDGHTLGRLHFDPFDNFLCQLSGKKQVLMFEPHDNRKLYEAHIPQATLRYNKHLKAFRRKGLEDSTSMVMSPVDIQAPDLERFPLFAEAKPLNCTIDEGDALFMPSFWWHEVYSWPNMVEKRNLAVNYWYEPFLQKEFPCPECKLHVNPFYYDLL